jgi:4-amino-4-deoxy-L-arabinose transferase-like glycosyltransferase
VSLSQHGFRVAVLMAGAAALFGWMNSHAEVTFADGLRYIHQAEKIEQGAWGEALIKGVDHPLHPMALAAMHGVIGGEGPASWQRAAQVVAVLGSVLLVIPLYLIALEVYGTTAAWLAPLLFLANPLMGFVTVNVLSETTFALFWAWGLWAAVRFLREGRFVWLPLTIGFGALAYLTRPEGVLLLAALVATLLVLPLHWATRIYWPRWWAAVGFLVIGPALLVGPYVAAKGGIGTKPSIARFLGTEKKSAATAIERERPLPADQSTYDTYRQATQRMLKVIRAAVTMTLLPVALLGLVMTRPWSARARVWLFSGIILGASAFGLVRLHATGGYCTIRHGLIPGMLLTLAAANGVAWLMKAIVIPGRWLGQGGERFRPGPAVWATALGGLVVFPHMSTMTPYGSSFAAYRQAGDWIARTKARDHGKVFDMTDWSLFFSGQPGFRYSEVYWASVDPTTRWVVVRDAHLNGHWHYARTLNEMIEGQAPVAAFPEHPDPSQVQVLIYDRRAPKTAAVARRSTNEVGPRRGRSSGSRRRTRRR